MPYFVYIMANGLRGTLYIGATNDLVRRAYEHREGLINGFSKRYGVKSLVHFELFDDVEAAIRREKRLKHWNRQWKIDLIERLNPEWDDLYNRLL